MMEIVDLSPEVEAQLLRALPADTAEQAQGIFNPSQDDRILRAVLTLADGDLERLRHYAAIAETDHRDVLFGRRLLGSSMNLGSTRSSWSG